MQQREVTHLVEDAFLQCHTAEEVRETSRLSLSLPLELRQPDRRELDDAVFELLGVADAARRGELIDLLYREVAAHFRSVRIVEVQKMEQRRHGAARENVSQMQLALHAWDEIDANWKTPLGSWLQQQHSNTKNIKIPEGDPRLPDAANLFDTTTVYFGRKPAVSHVSASRSEAELVFAVAQAGLRGPISIPSSEDECRRVAILLASRLAEGRRRMEEIVAQFAGTAKLREQVVEILYRWFIQGEQN